MFTEKDIPNDGYTHMYEYIHHPKIYRSGVCRVHLINTGMLKKSISSNPDTQEPAMPKAIQSFMDSGMYGWVGVKCLQFFFNVFELFSITVFLEFWGWEFGSWLSITQCFVRFKTRNYVMLQEYQTFQTQSSRNTGLLNKFPKFQNFCG